MMTKALVTVLLVFSTLFAMAQNDSTEFKVVDVVYLKEGGSIRGDITSFDEKDGGLVIKDERGRVYSLGRDDYNWFEENKLIPTKRKRQRTIYARKENEIAVDVGVSISLFGAGHNFTADENYINAPSGITETPLCLTFGIGKHLDKQHYVGFSSDLQLLNFSFGQSFFNAGVKYAYQYGSESTNTALYVPVEAKYGIYKGDMNYSVNDTIFDAGSFTYPSSADIDYTVNMASISVGQGFGFMKKDKKSIQLELSLTKYFELSTTFSGAPLGNPQSSFSPFSFDISLAFHL